MPQQPLSNAFAQQPQSLASNVPTSEQPDPFAEFDIPQGGGGEIAEQQAEPVAAAPQVAEDPFAIFDSPEGMAPTGGAAGRMSTQAPPEGMEAIREQLSEMGTRFKNAFTITNKESLQVLRESGMFGDVRVGEDGEVEVKRRGREGFEKFDRDQLELIGDTVDGSRLAMEAVVENFFRVGGAVSGALGGTTVGPAGTVAGGTAGAVAGGAAGAVISNTAGDLVAEKLLGIDRDESRSRTKEGLVAAAFGAGFSALGSKASKAIAVKLGDKLAATKTLQFAKEKAEDAIAQIQKVRESGLKLDSKAQKFSLDPQQLTGGEIPDITVTAKELSRQLGFQNFRREQGDMLKGAYQSMIDSIGAGAGKVGELGKDFVLKAKDIRQVEGKLIRDFRKLAQKELADQPQQAVRLAESLGEATASLGGPGAFMNLKGKGKRDMAAKVLSEFPSFTPSQANIMVDTLGDIGKKLEKGAGHLKVDDAEKIYTGLRKQIDNSINTASGRSFGLALVRVKDAVRDDWTQMIGNVLPEGQKAAYAKSMARYSEVLGAHKTLKSALQTEDISRDALVSKLFEGKGSLKFARSAKTLIDESDPKFWNELTGEYFTKLKGAHTDDFGTVNWAGMGKKWRGLGKEMQQELATGSGIPKEGLESLFHIGSLHQKTNFKALPTKARVGLMKNIVNVIAPTFVGIKAPDVKNLLEGMGKQQSLMVWLKDGGLEETLKHMPGLKQSKAQALRGWVSDWTPNLVKQAGKTATRQQVQKVGNE